MEPLKKGRICASSLRKDLLDYFWGYLTMINQAWKAVLGMQRVNSSHIEEIIFKHATLLNGRDVPYALLRNYCSAAHFDSGGGKRYSTLWRSIGRGEDSFNNRTAMAQRDRMRHTTYVSRGLFQSGGY